MPQEEKELKETYMPTVVRKMRGWVARDSNGELNLHLAKPSKSLDDWFNLYCIALDKEQFQELKWSDQPLEVEVVIGIE